eukprot:GHUV01029385.1.p1 GENE.GHUV01029385.1~~GHUV01029385.1.p1  ORF type:complete len:279 (+),score=50.18 GHUV01029385.1:711-1547(+)
MKHSEGGVSKHTSICVLVLCTFILVDLLYFPAQHNKLLHDIHTRQIDDVHCQRHHVRQIWPISINKDEQADTSSSWPNSSVPGGAATPGSDAARTARGTVVRDAAHYDDAVRYLQQVVFYDKTQTLRKPLENFWLPHTKAPNKTLEKYREKVATYLRSAEFKERWNALKLQVGNERGIVISAGGSYYLPQAVVLLRILRHHHRSTLPVELFWYGDKEMDAATLQNLKAEFGPLEGYDVTREPYPSHHFPGATLRGFPMKPYALLKSRYAGRRLRHRRA